MFYTSYMFLEYWFKEPESDASLLFTTGVTTPIQLICTHLLQISEPNAKDNVGNMLTVKLLNDRSTNL